MTDWAKTAHPCGVSRRVVLTGVGAMSLGLGFPVRAQSSLSLDRFLAVSSRLCDLSLDSTTLGADILAVLTFEFTDAKLNALVTYVNESKDHEMDFETRGLQPLVSRLVAIWYSGIAPTKTGNARVLSYTEAAGWAATGYAKPPSYCGPAFGEWAGVPDFSQSAQ